MRVAILGYGNSNGETVDELKRRPSFRKASLNMTLAFEAIQSASAGMTIPSHSAMVVGSSYGELENTKEFLKTFENSGLARPMLFQSSLHNGTLGFLALELGVKGPSFTVSQSHFTAEKSIDLAMDLIKSGTCEICLVATVDCMSKELLPALQQVLGAAFRWQDQASAIILCSDAYATKMGHAPKAFLEELTFRLQPRANESLEANHSDGLYHFNLALKDKPEGELIQTKLDHRSTFIKWSKP